MAGYLDQYGESDERRSKVIGRIIVVGLAAVIAAGLIYYIFKNHSQERVAKDFIQRLRRQDYAGAYRLWGCTQSKPCPDYTYDKFLEDWGAKNSGLDPARLSLEDSETCGSGVILTVYVSPERQEKLWVEKKSPSLGFSPVPRCPHKGPLSIMFRRTLGKLRKPFLK